MTCYSKPTFPLLKLPYLPFDLIIKMMKIGEIMLMSICSKRLSYLVKLGKYSMDVVQISVKTGDLRIEVNRTSEDYCDFRFNSKENGAIVPKGWDSLAQWFKNGNSDVLNCTATGSIKAVFSVCNRLRSDFRIKHFCWKIFPEQLKERNLKSLVRSISRLDFDYCFKVYFIGGNVDTRTLSYLIDRLNYKNRCSIEYEDALWLNVPDLKYKTRLTVTSKIPSNFKHLKAFNFPGVEYEDARWITVKDLKTIRRGSSVHLIGRTNFDNHDINELIKYWTECKDIMFSRLRIKLREGIQFNMDRVRRGVITCNSNGKHFFISKKLIQTHSIGCVEFRDGIVTLSSCKFASQLGWMVPVLKLLEQQSNLNMSYSELIKRGRQLGARLEDEEEENDLEQEFLKIESEKRKVENEFYEVIGKLRHYQVENVNPHLEPVA